MLFSLERKYCGHLQGLLLVLLEICKREGMWGFCLGFFFTKLNLVGFTSFEAFVRVEGSWRPCGMAGFTMQGHLSHHSQSWLKNHKNKNKVETQWLSEYICIECET